MIEHEEEDPLIEQYWSLRPPSYPNVEFMDIYQQPTNGAYGTSLRMTCWSSDRSVKNHLVLEFEGVKDLRITPQGSLIQLSLLEIMPTKHAKWERVRYKVKETEDLLLSFLCCDFRASIV